MTHGQTRIRKWAGLTTVAVLAVGGLGLVGVPPAAAQACGRTAFAPFSPARHEIAGQAEQRNNGGCPEVDYEILIRIDAAFAPDPTVARVQGRGTNFSDVARGRCGPPTGQDTRGFYTELRINGDSVAESPRVQLEGCRA